MSDEELGAELYPDDPAAGAAHARLMAEKAPARREAMVHLVETARAIQLWEAGLGPKPTGVIMCGPKQVRGGRW